VNGELAARSIEEDEVEIETHGKGVDAGAMRDQQADAGLLAVQPGETEQAAAEGRRDRNQVAVDVLPRQGFETSTIAVDGHRDR
jgi:hypothetical protein